MGSSRGTNSAPPPLQGGQGWTWVKEELDRKANQDWVQAKFDALDKQESDTRKIALSGKKKAEAPHACSQEDTIEEMMKTINGWRTVKLGVGISLVVVIAAVLAQFFAFKSQAEGTERMVVEVKASMEEISKDVDKVSEAVEGHLDWTEREKMNSERIEKRRLKAISDTVKIAIKESNKKR